MTIALDGEASSNQSSAVTLSTTATDDVVVVSFGHCDTNNVTSIIDTSGQGLTWNPRGLFHTVMSGRDLTLETWWAHVPTALTSCVITALHTGGAWGESAIIAKGISGADFTAPFDPNVSFPGTANDTSSSVPTVTGLTSTATAGLVFGIVGLPLNLDPGNTPGAGFTYLDRQHGSGSIDIWLAEEYKIVSSALASETDTYGTGTPFDWAMMVDMVVEAGGLPPPGGSGEIVVNVCM